MGNRSVFGTKKFERWQHMVTSHANHNMTFLNKDSATSLMHLNLSREIFRE
jgi:hypothetical protein